MTSTAVLAPRRAEVTPRFDYGRLDPSMADAACTAAVAYASSASSCSCSPGDGQSVSNQGSNFLKYAVSPLRQYILPIIPAGANLGPDSSLPPDNLGKVPGTYSRSQGCWYGHPGWQRHVTKVGDLRRWEGWQKQEPGSPGVPVPIGIRLSPLIGADFDINNGAVSAWAQGIAVETLGEALAVRIREGSCRVMSFYLQDARTALPITKNRIAFKLPATGDEVHLIEILGLGQQAVIEGPHAKGAMHRWRGDKGLADLKRGDVRPEQLISVEHVTKFMQAIRAGVQEQGGEIVRGTSGATRDRSAEHDIASPDNPHRIKEDELPRLTRCMQAIDSTIRSSTMTCSSTCSALCAPRRDATCST